MPNGLLRGVSTLVVLSIFIFILVSCASRSEAPAPTGEIESEFHTYLEPRTLDGSNNNPFNRNLGKAGTPYLCLTEANYEDGLAKMVLGPEPRYVSNRVFNDTSQNLFSENKVTQRHVITALNFL